MTWMDMLREFQTACGNPPALSVRWLTPDTSLLRIDLVEEELEEYKDAVQGHGDGTLVDVADALADAIYVLCGTAHEHGIDLDAVMAEVHRSNMTKFIGGPLFAPNGKLLKGEHYEPPELEPILFPERAE